MPNKVLQVQLTMSSRVSIFPQKNVYMNGQSIIKTDDLKLSIKYSALGDSDQSCSEIIDKGSGFTEYSKSWYLFLLSCTNLIGYSLGIATRVKAKLSTSGLFTKKTATNANKHIISSYVLCLFDVFIILNHVMLGILLWNMEVDTWFQIFLKKAWFLFIIHQTVGYINKLIQMPRYLFSSKGVFAKSESQNQQGILQKILKFAAFKLTFIVKVVVYCVLYKLCRNYSWVYELFLGRSWEYFQFIMMARMLVWIINFAESSRIWVASSLKVFFTFFASSFSVIYFKWMIFSSVQRESEYYSIFDSTGVNPPPVDLRILLAWSFQISFLLYNQIKIGPRFFLPWKWRTRKVEYQRQISDDYKVHLLSEEKFPEWDLCLQKLDQPPLSAESELKYSMYQKETCLEKTLSGIYIRMPEISHLNFELPCPLSEAKYHPQWFVRHILSNSNQFCDRCHLSKIDEFSD